MWRCSPTSTTTTATDKATIEQLLAVQTQLLQALVQNQQNHPVGGAPHDKCGEFLKGHLPVFSHTTDPLEADDWLHVVEKQLNIAQCDDQQKVLYASGRSTRLVGVI